MTRISRYILFIIALQGLASCFLYDNDGDSQTEPVDTQLQSYEGRATLEAPLAGSQVVLCTLSTFIDTGMCVPVYQTYTENSVDCTLAGTFNIPKGVIDNSEPYYLIKIQGGVECTPDNSVLDTPQSTGPIGEFHAVLKPDQIQQGGYKVSILTEIMYQRVEIFIESSWDLEPLPEEVELAAYNALTGDVNGDGEINSDDVAIWDSDINRDLLPYTWDSYRILIDRIRNNEQLGYLAIAFSEEAGSAEYIDVAQNMAFVSQGSKGVYVFDLTKSDIYQRRTLIHAFSSGATYDSNPIVSRYARAEDLKVIGELIYMTEDVGAFGTGLGFWGTILDVYDITKIPQPVVDRLASDIFEGLNPMPLVQLENHIVIPEDDEYSVLFFYNVDVSNPTDPIANVIATYYRDLGDVLVNAELVAGTGQTVFVTDGLGNLFAIDMQNPGNPSIVDQIIPDASYIYAMEAEGSVLYLYGDSYLMHVYDIKDPTDMQSLGSFDLREMAPDFAAFSTMALGDEYLFIASGVEGSGRRVIHKLDVQNPIVPRYLGSLDTSEYRVYDIAPVLPALYTAEGGGGLGIYHDDEFLLH